MNTNSEQMVQIYKMISFIHTLGTNFNFFVPNPQALETRENSSLIFSEKTQNGPKDSKFIMNSSEWSEKRKVSQIQTEAPEKNQNSSTKTESKQKKSKEKANEKQGAKPKRPKNYLTERSFYMSQKLKSKQRSDKRILRKRPKQKEKKTTKVTLRSGEEKKKKQTSKHLFKSKGIKKESSLQKEKEKLEKIKENTLKNYREAPALIQSKIRGPHQINLFIRMKYESLLKRKVS